MSAVSAPLGFTWPELPVACEVFRDGASAWSTHDVAAHRPTTGATYFVDVTLGLDANDGTTPATAFKRMITALNKPDVGTIMVAGGTYTRTQGAAGQTISKTLAVIGYNGRPLFGNHDPLAWTKTTGYTSVHHAARPAVGQVADMRYGMPGFRYRRVSSIALVDATPGSWFTDDVRVYVNTRDGRTPDDLIHCHLSTSNFRFIGDVTVYLENIAVHGGQAALDVRAPAIGVTGPDLFMKDVELGYAGVTNNLNALGARLSIAQRCDAYHSNMDGFNYHAFGGVTPTAVEIDCRGFSNGGASSSDNGSTMHDGGTIVRVGGAYWDNHGGNVVDVNAGTQSWNLGVRAWGSRLGHDFLATSGAAAMWLEGCTAHSSWRSAEAALSATIFATDSHLDRVAGNVHECQEDDHA